MARTRKATERDLAGIVAEHIVSSLEGAGDYRSINAFRRLPEHVQQGIADLAADERQRRAAGIKLTD
ncbi:hypothetical protein [Micromonospora sp. WMMD1274]|uniref:hypothetical protein n=1 Tax=Micromonospora sp. WMMD1274 TaxID=3404116 RepID=UPI003B93B959